MFRGHFYAHHQELETICVLLPPVVWDALVAGCWRSSCNLRCYAFGMRDVARLSSCNIPHHERIAGCPAPDLQQPANKASHTIGGNNTHVVSNSWWWTYKCPKHAEHIISAINLSVASSRFFFSTHILPHYYQKNSFVNNCYIYIYIYIYAYMRELTLWEKIMHFSNTFVLSKFF